MIRSCINRVEYSLLLNENISKSIKPARSLHQGDPLSPILFIIGSEVLSRLLHREELNQNFHGIKMDKSGPAVSHLLYADDLLVMSRVAKKETETFRRCFDIYCSWSGQEANLDKSNILFCKNSTHMDKRDILEATGFK